MTSGVLVVDKTGGLTSHDVVAVARRALGERRIGHCGTLDPMATGVLALAIGPATRLVQFLSGDTKDYQAVVRFGQATTTYDVTGEVVAASERRPSRAALDAALDRFRGPLMQVPPAYSAKKIGGVRSYRRARQNTDEAPPLAPASVTCHDLSVTFFEPDRVGLTMTVSAGFYVRSLANDLGEALDTVAALESLRRTRSGQFQLADAVRFDDLATTGREPLAARVVPMSQLLPKFPAVPLTGPVAQDVRHGKDVAAPPDWLEVPPVSRLVDQEGRLVAIAVPADRPRFLHPSVVLG
jgi:tRNA pseudouridine55 synthase